MAHNCFISFKKEDIEYKNKIIDILDEGQIKGKSLDKWIESEDIEYIMKVIRTNYLQNTSVTLFLIGQHSSENEGFEYSYKDNCSYNKQNFIIRELKASLYDGPENRRNGILGIVLPDMYDKIYINSKNCSHCGKKINIVNINEETVIKEFAENYYIKTDNCNHYNESGRFCVLVKYDDFIKNPNQYINQAYNKINDPINNFVHWKDIDHKYKQ